eukprot:EG_transcript_23343
MQAGSWVNKAGKEPLQKTFLNSEQVATWRGQPPPPHHAAARPSPRNPTRLVNLLPAPNSLPFVPVRVPSQAAHERYFAQHTCRRFQHTRRGRAGCACVEPCHANSSFCPASRKLHRRPSRFLRIMRCPLDSSHAPSSLSRLPTGVFGRHQPGVVDHPRLPPAGPSHNCTTAQSFRGTPLNVAFPA